MCDSVYGNYLLEMLIMDDGDDNYYAHDHIHAHSIIIEKFYERKNDEEQCAIGSNGSNTNDPVCSNIKCGGAVIGRISAAGSMDNC